MIPWRTILSLLLLIAVLAGVTVWQHRELMAARAETAQARADFKTYRDRAEAQALAEAARRQARDAASERERREALNAAHAETERLRAAVLAASAERNRLRDDAQTLAAAYRSRACNSAPAGGSADTGDPGSVFADVLGEVDDFAGEVAVYADRLRIALGACQRSYLALTPR